MPVSDTDDRSSLHICRRCTERDKGPGNQLTSWRLGRQPYLVEYGHFGTDFIILSVPVLLWQVLSLTPSAPGSSHFWYSGAASTVELGTKSDPHFQAVHEWEYIRQVSAGGQT